MRSLNHIHSSSGSQILIYTPWSLCGQNVCVCGCVRVCVCVCLGVFGWGSSRFFQEIFSLRNKFLLRNILYGTTIAEGGDNS